jgi:D-aminopeptidase
MGIRGSSMCMALIGVVIVCVSPKAQTPAPRARDLGVPFEGTTGPLNAITDVAGVEVGHVTLIRSEGALVVGSGPVRTGVTAILPRGKRSADSVFGGWFTLNGAGEMTGTTWLEERGFLEGPVLITNTHSVGVVRDATIDWMLKHGWRFSWTTPVVAETYDGGLNDINGFHVQKQHVFEALDSASSGPVQEGNVGGGTGMTCHQFKGGIGTSSRRLTAGQGGYIVGVLVQCNYGSRAQLRIAGVPVGTEITDLRPCVATAFAGASAMAPPCASPTPRGQPRDTDAQFDAASGDGSIIIVVATDAPLLPHQLKRIAKRASLGIGRMGGTASNGSGDIFIAFSTANPGVEARANPVSVQMLGNDWLSPLFEATAQATEEAITNALVAARTLSGANGYTVHALPHDRLRDVLRKYSRLQ